MTFFNIFHITVHKVGRLFDPNVNYAERRKEAENTISQLSDITDLDYANKQPGGKRLNESDLVYSVKVLRNIIKLNISNSSLNIIQPASNILDPRNKRTWDSVKVRKPGPQNSLRRGTMFPIYDWT